MVASEYYIGGVPLDDPAGRWFVTSETLLPTVSAARAPSVTVPYRSGVLPLPTRTVDPFQVTVKVVVQDGGRGAAAWTGTGMRSWGVRAVSAPLW